MSVDFLNALKKDKNPLSGNIITRTIMTKIVIRIYPNGDIYPDHTNSSTWITDQTYKVKKKKKKKGKEVPKEVEVQVTESNEDMF